VGPREGILNLHRALAADSTGDGRIRGSFPTRQPACETSPFGKC
jgi:hypothetical protein